MRTLVMIPAYNEEGCIEFVVDNLIRNYPQFDYVIVNDGSTDATRRICEAKGYNVINLPFNMGLKNAFRTAMRYADENGYDAAVQFDADGQHLPEYIQPMLDALSGEHLCDIVQGSRFLDRKKPVSLRMIGSYVIEKAIHLVTGATIHDPTAGMRMYNRAMIREFAEGMNYGPEPDTITYLIRSGAKVTEIPVEMNERIAGQSYLTLSRSVQYMTRMLLSIVLIQWFRKRPAQPVDAAVKGEIVA